ncbi:hypothetical protein AWI07_15615 [Enterobacter roggenkampii]|nr:hypothetical protein AWI07_15615 [Enterobacter roggenkampii]
METVAGEIKILIGKLFAGGHVQHYQIVVRVSAHPQEQRLFILLDGFIIKEGKRAAGIQPFVVQQAAAAVHHACENEFEPRTRRERDLLAGEQLADQYLDFASHGFHVISANKLAGASSTDKYRQIHDAFEKTGRHWLYNATVGAGLPVNHTVRDLIESGDSILALSGIFSGTLSWLFLQFDGTVPFTDLVDQAWQQGLTEPDPRVDLSGKDVMRKLVILAREAGYDIEPDSVRVESLVPAGCEEGSVDHFFENGEELNEQMVQRLEAANEMGLVLRYVARFEANGKARVGVEAVRPEHPLAALLPCDNVFAIESRWYRDNPLVIRGPGAGRDVTAGAIQSDINRLAKLL